MSPPVRWIDAPDARRWFGAVARLDQSLRIEREVAFRRALKHAGYLPQSIEVAVRKHRDWIDGR